MCEFLRTDNHTRSIVLDAIEIIERQTCINFVKVDKDDNDVDHIVLFTCIGERYEL